MIDRYRLYSAYFIAPVISLLIFLSLWLQPCVLCNMDTECFRKLPITVVLFMTYLLYVSLFLSGISGKARSLYGDSGLPFWELAKSSAHGPLLLAIITTAFMLLTEIPGTVNEWVAAMFAVLLPFLAACMLYISWYLIVGRENRQIKLDVQKERIFTA